ncbi:hypothetical protein ABZ547_08115 [Streptomyces sparsogenes]|uniref:hypothetical protein n=1 Tax=Streptomyces sparsogenes TaxID=67365 RepID=UPI0033CDE9CF
MSAYLVRHQRGQRDDILIDAPDLTLTFEGDWAIFSDSQGPSLAVPAERGATIQRIDPDDTGQEQDDTTAKGPAPQE